MKQTNKRKGRRGGGRKREKDGKLTKKNKRTRASDSVEERGSPATFPVTSQFWRQETEKQQKANYS